jgi:hypothetical protein
MHPSSSSERSPRSTSARTRWSSSAGPRSRCHRFVAQISRGRRPRRRAFSSGGEPATPRRCSSRRRQMASRSSRSHSMGPSGGPSRWRIPMVTESRCTRRISLCSGQRAEVDAVGHSPSETEAVPQTADGATERRSLTSLQECPLPRIGIRILTACARSNPVGRANAMSDPLRGPPQVGRAGSTTSVRMASAGRAGPAYMDR